jgi:hypothetical protein
VGNLFQLLSDELMTVRLVESNQGAGLIPLVIFWVERAVTRRIRAEHPELASAG